MNTNQSGSAIDRRITRRQTLAQLGSLTLTSVAARNALYAATSRPIRILLRSAWQSINIGDIAHTPGVLRLIEEHLPNVAVTLWPSNLENGVRELLLARFPNLKIVSGRASLERAFDECDFLLHGSSASLSAQHHVVDWIETTGKPFGVYGITFSPRKSWVTSVTPAEEIAASVEVLNQAKFVYFRDSESLRFAKSRGCVAPVMAFGPDGAFACDLRNDVAATKFLEKSGLQPGNYLCCIPRMRYTPTWMIPGKNAVPDPIKFARNEQMKEHDHAPLREAIIEVTRNTNMKVLVCPEDQTQMQIGKELLFDPLPADVKGKVVWREDFWLTDEAISTYTRSVGLFGNELHSAIMCIGHGIPAIICRWAEQTSKGTMWRDIHLDDWLFDLDSEQQCKQVAPAVLEIASDPAAAKAKAARAIAIVKRRQVETMMQLKQEIAAIK